MSRESGHEVFPLSRLIKSEVGVASVRAGRNLPSCMQCDYELVCSCTLGCGLGPILLLSEAVRRELLLLSTSLLFFLWQTRKHMTKRFYFIERTLTSQEFTSEAQT